MNRRIGLALAVSVLCAACALNEDGTSRSIVEGMTSVSGAKLPEPSAGYKPPDTFKQTPKQVFAAAIAALDEMRIPVTIHDAADGRIVTDYAAGPRGSTAFGILGITSSRYKYLVSVRDAGKGTRVTVTAFLESSGSGVPSWRDVSAENKALVTRMQAALIEQIEKSLK